LDGSVGAAYRLPVALTLGARPTPVVALWTTSVGKKAVMAVSGLIMVLFLLLHMLGNLKIFFGPTDYNHYAAYLRTIGEPVLHGAWFLYILRVILGVAVIAHFVAAYQLSRRDQKARPTKYVHASGAQKNSFATHTMRWGGVILLLFIVWHLLDLSAGVANPHYVDGNVYGNVVADFTHWWPNVIYIVAMLALGLHINHGFWSAANTLGYSNARREVGLKIFGTSLAVFITVGFLAVPIAVMAGLVR
jgi:succinate dehydrogenase / fumarate reductase cytochrome b subunit